MRTFLDKLYGRAFVRALRAHSCCMYVRAHENVSAYFQSALVRKVLTRLRVRQSFAYIARRTFLTKVKSVPRVTFRTLILSLPFNNFAAHACLHSSLHSLFLSAFLSSYTSYPFSLSFSLSLFPVCTLAVCLTDPLDLTWHKQQSLCKKALFL